jgi:signal transduction histidine kinase
MSDAEVDDLRRQLEMAQAQLAKQSRQLELIKEDKATFLDSLSGELRTPLESIVILSNHLTGNEGGNLTPEQVEYATVIHRSSTDLLQLINELLSLLQSPRD